MPSLVSNSRAKLTTVPNLVSQHSKKIHGAKVRSQNVFTSRWNQHANRYYCIPGTRYTMHDASKYHIYGKSRISDFQKGYTGNLYSLRRAGALHNDDNKGSSTSPGLAGGKCHLVFYFYCVTIDLPKVPN